MAQIEKAKPHAHTRTASTDQRTPLWKRFFAKDECLTMPLSEDVQKPGIARRLSRKVVPGLPRPGTFKRQHTEARENLQPAKTTSLERRAASASASIDRLRRLSDRNPSTCVATSPRLSAPNVLDDTTIDTADKENSRCGALEEEGRDLQNVDDLVKVISNSETQSVSTTTFDEMILLELERKWILNLSMHFRDKTKREKFFVTYAETPTHWRRVTISLDYRAAPEGSLEEELQRTRFQRDKNARIYEAIRESLLDIQFYDTVTNLKLQTENDRLHVHVVEDLSEVIQYPPVTAINNLACRRVRESELVFDSHLSGFVYKVRIDGQVYIKKEIPGPDSVDEFLYEINALHQLSESDSVILFGGVVLDNRGEFVKGILISFAEKGALIDVIYDGEGQIPWKRRERWAKQIVQGLSEIHESGFVQGDFTLSNIVIDADDNAKIIDINRRGCPVGWEPPEVAALVASNQRISMYIGVKSDLYQLGMVLYALATQEDEPENCRPFKLDVFPPDIPAYFAQLCSRCLHNQPRYRSPASTLLSMFPEIGIYQKSHEIPAPIVVDALYDERALPVGRNFEPFDLHSLQDTDQEHVNVYDYKSPGYFPQRGRSPPILPQRQVPWQIPLPSSSSESDLVDSNSPATPTADETLERPSKDDHDQGAQNPATASTPPRNTAAAITYPELADVGTGLDISAATQQFYDRDV